MKSHEIWERSIAFIEHELLPEMVHDRYFCEPNSREFVEFDSATIRLDELSRSSEIYRVTVAVKFSGEPRSFPLGRYGRTVIVLEDLEKDDYKQVDGELDENHLKLCVQVLAKFHARGLRLKATEPGIFREFEAKLLEISLTEEAVLHYEKRSTR